MDLFEYIEKCKREMLISTLTPIGFDSEEEKKLKERDKIRKGEITIIPKRSRENGK